MNLFINGLEQATTKDLYKIYGKLFLKPNTRHVP